MCGVGVAVKTVSGGVQRRDEKKTVDLGTGKISEDRQSLEISKPNHLT